MASVPPTATQKLFDSSYGNSQVTKNTFVQFLITQSVFKVSSLYMNKDNEMNSLLCDFTLCESFLQEIPFLKLLNYIVLVLCWKILSQMWMWCFENLSKKKENLVLHNKLQWNCNFTVVWSRTTETKTSAVSGRQLTFWHTLLFKSMLGINPVLCFFSSLSVKQCSMFPVTPLLDCKVFSSCFYFLAPTSDTYNRYDAVCSGSFSFTWIWCCVNTIDPI